MYKYFYTTIVVFILLSFFIGYNYNNIKNYIDLNESQGIFSRYEVLTNLWEKYKNTYVDPASGRTIDRQRNMVTTSEGQSYTMIRAVWMDDKEIFDKSWDWTKNNLQRKDDKLFSWLYGNNKDGKLGILADQGGFNTASDADIDIALSLVMAANRWGQKDYLNQASTIIKSIWKVEVAKINGKYILLSNDLEKHSLKNELVVNPSYFSPHAYRVFTKIDNLNPWNQLADDTYDTLAQVTNLKLDNNISANIPPDWFQIDSTTGLPSAIDQTNLTTNYSYDALRTPWRIALDYYWNNSANAKNYLDNLKFFSDEWNKNNKLVVSYSHSGKDMQDDEGQAMYGGTIGYFLISDNKNADEIYSSKLEYYYNQIKNDPDYTLSYYDSNWLWFGIAMYKGALYNMTTGIEDLVSKK